MHAWRTQNRRLKALNIEIATVEERERRRLAQGLHDTTVQQLVLARMLLDGLSAGGVDRDNGLRELVDTSLRQLRTLVFELSPPLLRDAGLAPALERLVETMESTWDLPIAFDVSGRLPALPEATALLLFQGARELLVNAAKHAHARALGLALKVFTGTVEVAVSDDGRGFGPVLTSTAGPVARAAGYGLRSTFSRLELIGGRIEIADRAPGTRVRLVVPVGSVQGPYWPPDGGVRKQLSRRNRITRRGHKQVKNWEPKTA